MNIAAAGIFSSRRNFFDSAAQAFITAAGITDYTQKIAINTLVISAKDNGWWNKCIAIYPMVGGTSSSCKYNLKDARDLDAAYRLTFSGTPVFASTGINWNNSGYAQTYIIGQPINDAHMSFYSRTNSWGAGSGGEIGSYPYSSISMIGSYSYARAYINSGDAGPYQNSVLDTSGWFLTSKTASNTNGFYRNGTFILNNAGGDTGPSPYDLLIGGSGFYGSYSNGSAFEHAFATVGYGISLTLAATMYSDIQTFQTAFGRQV